jgi:hypothetical protein
VLTLIARELKLTGRNPLSKYIGGNWRLIGALGNSFGYPCESAMLNAEILEII